MGSHEEDYSSEELEELDNREFYLRCPDTGPATITDQMWIFDQVQKKMIEKSVKYAPGLFRMIDEILVNAADNKQRDNNMDCIEIELDVNKMGIKIWNNGKGLKIRNFDKKLQRCQHSIEDIDLTKPLIPTIAFGSQKHSSTNFKNDVKKPRYTGGRYGVGAKWCNAYSKKFSVKIGSKEDNVIFEQEWGNNMKEECDPKLTRNSIIDFTEIEFNPDLTKFGFSDIEKAQEVFASEDMLGIVCRRAYDVAATTCTKVWFNEYKIPISNFKEYIQLFATNEEDVLYDKLNDLWEIGLLPSIKKKFQHTSFVNSVATTGGGSHVECVKRMILKRLLTILKPVSKRLPQREIQKYCWIFINCLVDKPKFGGNQKKETLTTEANKLGPNRKLSDEFVEKLRNSRIVNLIREEIIEKQNPRSQRKIPQYFSQANLSPEPKYAQRGEQPGPSHITLEAESNCDEDDILDNQPEEDAESEHDSNTAEVPDEGEESEADDRNDINERQESDAESEHDSNTAEVPDEGEESEADDRNDINERQESGPESEHYDSDTAEVPNEEEQLASDNSTTPNQEEEEVLLQRQAVPRRTTQRKPKRTKPQKRSITQETSKNDNLPSVIDGLNVIEREVLKRVLKDNSEISLDDLVRDIMTSNPSFTEERCTDAAIGLGRTRDGSNNINLLELHCELYSKIVSADKIDSKNIFVKLSQQAKMVFNELDDRDGDWPLKWYIPVIPMILVNGVKDNIPNFNPLEIIKNLKMRLEDPGKDWLPMDPWYRNFNGVIDTRRRRGGFMVRGKYTVDNNRMKIIALPIGISLETYKSTVLNPLREKSIIVNYSDCISNAVGMNLIIDFQPGKLAKLIQKESIYKDFQLEKYIDTSSIMVLDRYGDEKRYKSIDDILNEFYNCRLEMYENRKSRYKDNLEKEICKLDKRIKYLKEQLRRNVRKNSRDNQEADSLELPCCGTKVTEKVIAKLNREKEDIHLKCLNHDKKLPEDLWKKDLEDYEDKHIVENEEQEVTKNKRKENSIDGSESDSSDESTHGESPNKRQKSANDSATINHVHLAHRKIVRGRLHCND